MSSKSFHDDIKSAIFDVTKRLLACRKFNRLYKGPHWSVGQINDIDHKFRLFM